MRRAILAIPSLIMALSYASVSRADVLITPREAKLPDADQRARGPLPGPRILVTNPQRNAGAVKSPFALTIKFESRDGVPIDLNSLVVVYEKAPVVDLTERVKAYLTPSGITMPAAEVPPGEHHIHIEIKDVNGRLGGSEFTIQTAP